MEQPLGLVPAADPAAEPEGFVVAADDGTRVHFLDWGGPAGSAGVLLIHGISQTAWAWNPWLGGRVAWSAPLPWTSAATGCPMRRPTIRTSTTPLRRSPVTPSRSQRAPALLGDAEDRVVLAGHGFGAIVAAEAAAVLGSGCAGLVLVDGGWEDIE